MMSLIAGSGYFSVLLTGQTLASISNGLIWGAPGLLSEIWFPASERATSTAVGAAVSAQVRVLHIHDREYSPLPATCGNVCD